MNIYLPYTAKLPSAYQEVEYIQSTGNQYIDTGYKYNGTYFRIDCKILFNSYSYGGTGANCPFICGVIGRSYGNMFLSLGADNHVFGLATGTQYETSITAQLGTVYDTMLEYKSGTMTFKANNDSVSVSSTGSFYTGKSIPLFCRFDIQYSGLYSYFCTDMRMYGCKIYSAENVLARDFVPCYRKSDSVIGLYDLVNNQFYTNSGTGTFSKGNDVTMSELKNAYIGEVWTPGTNTLLYLPFTDDLNDHSSNQTSTKGGTVSIATLDGVKCANFNSGYLTFPSKKWFNTNWTVSLFVKNPNNTTSGTSSVFMTSGVDGAGTEYVFLWNVIDSPYYINSNTYGSYRNNYVRYGYAKPSGWTHIVATQQGLTGKLYVNGSLVATNSSFSDNNITANTLYIGNNTDTPSESKWWLKAYLSELIIENTAWDATKVSHYYDITKGNYGL